MNSAGRRCRGHSLWTRQGLAWALVATMGGVVSAAGQRPDAPGTLLIISEPAEADVYVDGTPVGKTPVSVPTAAGDHRVRLVKGGFLDNSRVVTTSSRKPLTMRVTLTARAAPAASGQGAALTILVIEGEDAVNIIQQRTAVAPVVEVRDRNNQPVPGALVRFAIRNGRATFSGARTLSVTTDAAGRAAVTGFTPSGTGALQIGATASFEGQTAAVTIAQTNVLTAAQAAGVASAGGSAGAGAGAAGGAAAGGAAATATAGAAAGGAAAGSAGGISATAIGVAAGAAAGGTLVAVNAAGGDSTAVAMGPETGDYAGSLTLVAVKTARSPGLVGQPGAIGDTCTFTSSLAVSLLVVIDTDTRGTVTEGHVETRWTETEISRSCPGTTPQGSGTSAQVDTLDGQPATALRYTRVDTTSPVGGTVAITTAFSGAVTGSTVNGTFTFSRSATFGQAIETTPAVSGAVSLQRVAQ